MDSSDEGVVGGVPSGSGERVEGVSVRLFDFVMVEARRGMPLPPDSVGR